MRRRLAWWMLLTWAGIGCAADTGPEWQLQYGDDEPDAPAEPPEDDCGATSPAFEEVTAFDRCVTCHAATKSGLDRSRAPADVNFDTEDAAADHADRAAKMVRSGAMPPQNSGLRLTDAEKQQLYEWAMCRM